MDRGGRMPAVSDVKSPGQMLADSLDKVRNLGGHITRVCLTNNRLVLENEDGDTLIITEASVGYTDAGQLAAEIISRFGLVSHKEIAGHVATATLVTIERLEDGSVTIFVVKPGA